MGNVQRHFVLFVFFVVLFSFFTQVSAQTIFERPQKQKTALEYYEEGQIYQNKQDWYRATEYYQECLQMNPAFGQAWFSLAECAYALNEYDLAIDYTDTAAKYLKNNTSIPNLKGFSLVGLGRLDEARIVFNEVLNKYPNDTEARFGLAELDIFEGRISGAEALYQDALKRQPENRKALLSLALVSYELGKPAVSKKYINQALRYHSDNPEVHYFASYLLAKEGSWTEAEQRVRFAIALRPDYDEAYGLLASILYSTMHFQDVVDICEYRISRNRKLSSAWYLKGLALTRMNRIEEAIASYETGLEIDPEDEIMRSSMEQLVCEYLSIEDKRRAAWAEWHIKKANDYSQKYLSYQAQYEYKRALVINPNSIGARLAFAENLLRDGYPENYLAQLQFINKQDKDNRSVLDKIEAYTSLLEDSLSNKWNKNPMYMDKVRYSVGLYYMQPSVQLSHPDSDRLTSFMLAEMLSSGGTLNVKSYKSATSGYAEAFRLARQSGQDYFALVKFEENERELTVALTFYVVRTGNKAAEYKVYRTGNDRYANALRRMEQLILAAMPKKGRILTRTGSTVLIDLGKKENVAVDTKFNIIKQGKVLTEDKTIGAVYDDMYMYGTLTVTAVGEEISEGIVSQRGFYDRINAGDELLLAVEEEKAAEDVEEIEAKKQKPVLIDLIKSIR